MRSAVVLVSLLLGVAAALGFAEGMIWQACDFTNPLACRERARYLPLAYTGGLLLVGPVAGGALYHRLDRWLRTRRHAAV